MAILLLEDLLPDSIGIKQFPAAEARRPATFDANISA
jgi:hypothetical protein